MTDLLTDAELAALRALSDAATLGPWWTSDYSSLGLSNVSAKGAVVANCYSVRLDHEANAAFIAAARDAMPSLLALVEARDAEIARLKARIAELEAVFTMLAEMPLGAVFVSEDYPDTTLWNSTAFMDGAGIVADQTATTPEEAVRLAYAEWKAPRQ
jgi:hypothetical protein